MTLRKIVSPKLILILFLVFSVSEKLFPSGTKDLTSESSSTSDETSTTESDGFQELVSERKAVPDWDVNAHFDSVNFSYLMEGDEIEIKVSPMSEKSYSMFGLYTTSWKNKFYFTNISCTPNPYDTVEEKDGKKSTVIKMDRYEESYKIKIVLSKEEAVLLAKGGIVFNGHGFYLDSFKVLRKNNFNNFDMDEFEKKFFGLKSNVIKLTQYYREYLEYKTPIIFISTENQKDVLDKSFQTSFVSIFDSQGNKDCKAQVKVRGNSTSWGEEKPYRIKFEKKQNLLNLNNGRKYKNWVLLKTKWTFAHDYFGFNLAHKIYENCSFKYYSSDCAYVHVFVNQQYKGVYLLCEQNEIGKGRVNVDKNSSQKKSFDIGYMIEMDNYAWDDAKNARWFNKGFCWTDKEGFHFIQKFLEKNSTDKKIQLTDINGENRVLQDKAYTLKNKIYSDKQAEFIQKYLCDVWNICYQAIEKNQFYTFDKDYNLVKADFNSAKETIDAVIDLESLCNEIILEELVRDNDVGMGSLYMAIDFTKPENKKYHKLTFECPWDFNWAYADISTDKDGGLFWQNKIQYFAGAWQSFSVHEDKMDRSNAWFILFTKAPWFSQMLREKWESLGFENLKTFVKAIEKKSSVVASEQNFGNAKFVAEFLNKRIDYIEENLWK